MRTGEVKSAGRILDVLELLAGLPQGIRVNQLARTLEIPKSSASALLGTLAVRGYVEASGDGYALATGYRGGSWVGGTVGMLARACYPVMERLVAETGESAFLGIATPSFEVRYVAKVVSANPLRYDGELDSLRPAHSTSIGQVLLAALPPAELDDYIAHHELTRAHGRPPISERALRRVLAQVRVDGYVTIADSHVAGTSGVAAPVVAADRTLAGLAIIAPTPRFDAARGRIVPRVVAAARDLARAIGGGA